MKPRLLFVSLFLLTAITGCMTTRNGNKSDNPFPESGRYNQKVVAVLPVTSQKGITTDSRTPLKKSLNVKIAVVVKERLSRSKIVQWQESLEMLNDAGKLELVDKLLTGYETTGAYDKKIIASLNSALKADFIIIPQLKIESMDMKIAKTFVSSLEVSFIDKSHSEPIWSGIGDFKRFGAYGLGGTETDEAANELVSLAFGDSEQ